MGTDTSSFDMQRNMPLPPAKLWELLIFPAHREKWGVPDPSMVLEMENVDTRVGGLERHRCGPKDNPEFIAETRWYDLTVPERAVFTETLIFGGEAVATSLVTYALSGDDTSTQLFVTVAASSFSGPETLDEMQAGWGGGLDLLVQYAGQIHAPS
ncbi:Uncharacterized conserved protein YndB, AHSA1/START domain [Cognatiyoonia koreensis]|uniref:Uncharacterized conserved protein YndB, AHSA1/START domain n=1 Tax=Cognatiyoonia koreensis TaxID=364200 RepID=A0A1I0QIR3_9RHOB|nr:SRPBCC domain-containing protein [Cognatiyoonia koreensis]SEW27097.1 Uncharacterized conserved protein YndB, AHSA1/START domain [Cognatiyoonia koreensis]